MAFSTQKGLPALNELRPGFCRLGLVLPLDGLMDSVRLMGGRLSSLYVIESDELRGSNRNGVGVSDEDDRRLRVYEQLFGILYTHRLWKLNPQSANRYKTNGHNPHNFHHLTHDIGGITGSDGYDPHSCVIFLNGGKY
jgi:hypothetical protein